MQVRRFAAPLGAVVEGLDVREVDDAAWRQLNDLFCEHHVLVFPQQDLRPHCRHPPEKGDHSGDATGF